MTSPKVVVPLGLTIGATVMCIIDTLAPHLGPDCVHAMQDACGLVDLDDRVQGLDAQDLRLAAAQVVARLAFDTEELLRALRRRARWVESTAEGLEPCADPSAVADAIRAFADIFESL